MTDLATALNTEGLKYLCAANHELAISFFDAAIARDPLLVDAHTNRGVALYMNQQFDKAVAPLQHSLELRPDHPETLLNLGYALWRLDDTQGALAAFQRAIEVNDAPLAHIGLGSLLWELGNQPGAIEHSQIGLRGEPDNIIAHDTLREVYHYEGDEANSLVHCDALIRLTPGYPLHPHRKALIMMTYGYRDGWRYHEDRYPTSRDGLSRLARESPQWFGYIFNKRWEGQQTDHLLVQTEQGYGDIIQFLRYIPLAAERCNKLSLHLPPSVRRIARQTFTQPNIDICDSIVEHFDHYSLIMSLAYRLDRVDDIPPPPYLFASDNKYGEIRRLDGPKIGLVWTGSNEHGSNRWRNIPFPKLARLLQLPARFVSLQLPCDDDLRPYPIIAVQPTPSSFNGKLLIDWSETAALIQTLDLVIGVDTAVVHMAGALGKPVWLLNRLNTDWRWLLRRADTPWYPSMRIFRQPRFGDWDSVLDEVYSELASYISHSS